MLNILNAFLTNQASSPNQDANPIATWFKELWEAISTFFVSGSLPENSVANSILGKLVIAVVIFVAIWLIIKIIVYLIRRPSKKTNNSNSNIRNFTGTTLKVVLYFFLILSIISILGFNLSWVSQVVSSAIIAIGLSLQTIVQNFASGIILLTTKKFVKGDFISLNNGDVKGTIKEIQILDTKVLTADNILVSVPNSNLFTGIVENYSKMEYRRVEINMGVGYDADVDKIKKILIHTIKKQKGINQKMAISVFIKSFEASYINYEVRGYAPTSIFWDVKWDLQENLYKELIKRKAPICYNQLDVNLRKAPNREKLTSLTDIKDGNIDPSLVSENPADMMIVEQSSSEQFLKNLDNKITKANNKKKKKQASK